MGIFGSKPGDKLAQLAAELMGLYKAQQRAGRALDRVGRAVDKVSVATCNAGEFPQLHDAERAVRNALTFVTAEIRRTERARDELVPHTDSL
jgi:hypothetical protein